MSKNDDYRLRAEMAQREADGTNSHTDKAAGLQIAADWLSKVCEPKRAVLGQFDADTKARGTGK